MMTKVGAEPVQRSGRRGNNTAFAATPHDQFGQVSEPVILDCVRQKRGDQGRHSLFAEGTEPKFRLTFDGVALAVRSSARYLSIEVGRTSICSATNASKAAGGRPFMRIARPGYRR
jgi:hypothetical protein